MAPDSPLDILLVEDCDNDVFFFQRALVKSGISAQLHIAQDGAQAIKFLQQANSSIPRRFPHLLFLDLKLPNLNGFEVLEWIGRQTFAPSLPVLILTSSEELRDRERARQFGVRSYLVKPLSPDQLREAVQSHRTL